MRIKYIKDTLKEKRYLTTFFIFFIAYVVFYYWIISRFNGSFAFFLNSYRLSYLIPAITLNILTAGLVGIVFSLMHRNLTKLKKVSGKGSIFSGIGIFATALAAGCPGCFAGLFPFVLSLFGITASLSTLPFNGLELQVASVLLLSISTYTLAKEPKITCDVKIK
jgi:hypothetical protein